MAHRNQPHECASFATSIPPDPASFLNGYSNFGDRLHATSCKLAEVPAPGWLGAPGNYTASLYDLNGDGMQEAVIRLTSSDWCGSGGCTLLVASQHGHTWRLISKIALVHAPVLALERKRSGWHSLGVTVGGGGMAAHPVILDFRYGRYPANPTMPSMPAGSPSSTGKPLVSSSRCQAP